MRVVAVDLGATSVRVAAIDLDAPHPQPEIVHRFSHGPVEHQDGTLRWDWPRLVREVGHGLEAALAAGPIASIAVDGWAVDYGLLDADGHLLSLPYSYRDARTAGWQATVEQLGREHLYEVTGIQLMPINTIFQLAAHPRDELDRAEWLMLLPDLLVHHLTGWVGAERSNASTTALLDTHTGGWSDRLAAAVGIDPGLLPPLAEAGELAGTWRDVPVHLVGSHDTASAFLAVPGVPGPGTAIVSSGTWVLVGTERAEVDTSEQARRANFSNEGGALGGVRFLKNVMGFWLLEQCRKQWDNPPIEDLVADAAALDDPIAIVDASDDRFLAPDDMEREICRAAGLPEGTSRAAVTRCILESIAHAVAGVIDELATVTGTPVEQLFLVGGAARVEFMNQLLARHTERPVVVGSAEATAVGNALVQGLALGRFADLDAARRWVATNSQRVESSANASPRPEAVSREG